MKIQYNGSSKILKRLVELVNRSQNVALRQDNTDKNTLYWTGLDGVEITVNIPSGAVEVDTELSETSTNPVENQAITKELAQKADKSAIPTVGDGVLSVQRNGKSVGTFSANAAENEAINIPVPEKVSELENDAGYGTYTKPAAGIPKSDLASGVQASLGKADTALQKHQDISGKVDNTAAGADSLLSKITNSWTATPTDNTYFIRQDTSNKNEFGRVKFSTLWSYIKSKVESLGYTKNTGTITGIKMNGASKGTSGVVDLGTVITAHQDISGKQDKSTAVTHTANTAVGSTAKPVYIAADGKATPITHSVNSDVPSNAKFTDTVYTHPTTAGNKHIPAGGSSGQILRWSADGTAVWGADNNTTYGDATQSAHGLMTAADKKKLDGMDLSKYLPKDGTAKKAELLSSGQMRSAYCHNDDATFSNGYVWFKIGTAIASGGYATITTTFLGICGYGKHALYTARVRLTSAGNVVESISFSESGRTGGMLTGLFRIVAINGEKNVTFELWAKGASRWEGTKIVILNEMYLAGGDQGNFWTLTSRGNADAKTAPTTGNMHVDSSDSSTCATATNASNAARWNGLINDVDTYNSSDTWILVKKDNRIQHRYAGELDVNSAKTLVDSGWQKPTFPSGVKSSSIRYRKQGKIVSVTGYVQFSTAQTTITVFTLPTGYRPPAKIQQFNAVDSSAQASFLTKIDTDGKVGFFGKTQGFFTTATEYYMHCTFFVD